MLYVCFIIFCPRQLGPDTPLNKSWPGSPRSSAYTTPGRDNSFMNVSDLFSPYKRTRDQNELSQAGGSNLLTPMDNRSAVKQRRITLHSPMEALQRSHGYEPEESMDWTSAMMAKLPARFLNGKSSVQLERPPDVLMDESTTKPEVKLHESNKNTEQEKERDVDDKNTTDFDPEKMRRSIYERAFCKQQSYGVQFRKETKTTEDKKDESEEPRKLHSADSSDVGTAEKRDRRWSSDKRSSPRPLHPGVSVMSELSPLSPAWYPSPTETPEGANKRATPHLPSRFLRAMQTLQQPDMDLPTMTNQMPDDNPPSNESIQDSILSNDNSDDNQNVQNNLSANPNSCHNQNIQDGPSAKKETIHEEPSRDVQTLDDTGGNIELEPWELDDNNSRRNIFNKSPSQTQEQNNNLDRNLEQNQHYVSGHNLNGVAYHLTNSDHYANEAQDVVTSLAYPYMHITQSFDVANDIYHKQLPIAEQNSVTFGADLRRKEQSELVSDVETPRSFIDEETKFQDIFVNSCDQSEPLFEAVNQSDKTTPSRYKQVNSSDQSQSILETSDNTEVSDGVCLAESQSEDGRQKMHDSNLRRTYSKTPSRDVTDYDPQTQNEISRDRKVDLIHYIALERDKNDTYDLKGNTQNFNYDVAGVEQINSHPETRVKDSSQELEGLKRELNQGTSSTGNEDDYEHAQKEEKHKRNLVDATSVVTQTLTAMLKDSMKAFRKEKSVKRRHEITQKQAHTHSGNIEPEVLPEVGKQETKPGPEADETFIGNHVKEATRDRKCGERVRGSEDKVC